MTYCFPKGSLPPPSSPNNVFHTFGTSEGDTLTQQEPPRCSGIKQSGTMPPGQPLHAFHSCCSKGISFQKAFSRREGTGHVPARSRGAVGLPAAVSPSSPTSTGTASPCWWTDLLPSLRLDSFSHKPKQAGVCQSLSRSSVLSYV